MANNYDTRIEYTEKKAPGLFRRILGLNRAEKCPDIIPIVGSNTTKQNSTKLSPVFGISGVWESWL